jgi:hypothetical protein
VKLTSTERIELHECPESVTEHLRTAGGINRFGGPMFQVVWGYNRIVPMHGEWQEFEQFDAKLTDKLTGYSEVRRVTKLKSSVIETRLVPKYLPGNCWHLEMWRPPEEYGSPEEWKKIGLEQAQGMTLDTAGEYPTMGEYELCFPLTDDGTSRGKPLPLVSAVVEELVRMLVVGRETFTLQQRRAAIEQRARREENGYTKKVQDMLKDSLRPFAGEEFIVKPN